MQTDLSLEYAHPDELPPGHANEVRTPATLVEHFLREYSEPGDRVIDPFAGYGTTLTVADRLDREPYGIEYDADRVEYIEGQLETAEAVRHGDVLELEASWIPACDCCFTSPPFMWKDDERNPFENYGGESTYEAYLADIETAFTRLESVLHPDSAVIIDVANMKHEGEVVVTWDDDGDNDRDGNFGYGYDHSYCLVFRNRAE
ncbi:site-specific DNA-methyltransferase [Natronolimnobius sp. AArcel1]|uniref:DNA methyltransferase n=1 Tax=Natronolimnobius sp. AArcel1 TaxID=1679093 RepID=UPI0013EC3BAC|nr:DNA methyltransferase [Natronolimnobius sp. AArcel1]NGM69853.1 site-specific DNA-methyltransferase [Natronolimnobius sp. AArcel1]